MILSVDVGGSKVLSAVFSEDGKVVKSEKFETPVMYPDFIAELKKAIRSLIGEEQPTACTIALPGLLDREQGLAISFGNLPWENVHVIDDLRDTLTCPVYIENDANLAALSEAHLVPEYKSVLYVTVSTGIGGGYIIDGKIAPQLVDAEVGHILLEHGGELKRWQEFASGKAIVAHFGKRASDIPAEDSSTWYIIARNIAIGLINLVATLTPDVIVIGGGVGTHLSKFHEKLWEEMEIYENKMLRLPPIVQAKHPEEAVIHGGYLLATQKLSDQ